MTRQIQAFMGLNAPAKPWEMRKVLARQLANTDIAPELSASLMHYGLDGKPVNGKGRSGALDNEVSQLPMIRFRHARNGFGIIGVGEQAADLIGKNAHWMALALRNELGYLPACTVTESGVSIESCAYDREYAAISVVLRRHINRLDKIKALNDQELKVFCRQLIADGLNRQCAALQLSMDIDPEDIRVHSVSAPRHSKHNHNLVVLVSDEIRFSMPYKLIGSWTCGSFGSGGRGRIKSVQEE